MNYLCMEAMIWAINVSEWMNQWYLWKLWAGSGAYWHYWNKINGSFWMFLGFVRAPFSIGNPNEIWNLIATLGSDITLICTFFCVIFLPVSDDRMLLSCVFSFGETLAGVLRKMGTVLSLSLCFSRTHTLAPPLGPYSQNIWVTVLITLAF